MALPKAQVTSVTGRIWWEIKNLVVLNSLSPPCCLALWSSPPVSGHSVFFLSRDSELFLVFSNPTTAILLSYLGLLDMGTLQPEQVQTLEVVPPGCRGWLQTVGERRGL